jgi:hypothetical protein
LIDLEDVRLKSLGTGKVELLLEFRVFNTNTWDARLKRFDYVVRVEERELVKGSLAKPADPFRGLQWGKVEIPAALYLQNMPELLRSAGAGRTVRGDLRSEAVFEIIGIDIPVRLDKPIQFTRPRIPILHFRTLRLPAGAGAGDGAVEVVLDAENPNSFDLPTSGVKGQLLLGDKPLVQIDVPYPGRIPALGRQEVVLRVRMKVPPLDSSSWRSWLKKDAIRFEGQFELDHPISLREATGDATTRKN